MPIIKSARKRVKQAVVRRARNFNVRTALRKAIRQVMHTVKEGDKATAEENLSLAYKVIDTATKKGILQKNTAARRKSTLANAVAGISGKKQAVPKEKVAAPKKKAPAKKAPAKETKAE